MTDRERIRLTSLASCAGWAGKLAAEALAQVLRPIQETYRNQEYEGLIVGLDVADDAAVYKVRDDLAIVVTLDFFTPIVDDPYAYGAIAASNSLSDIYAMGATPIVALNVAALPKTLPIDLSSEIMRGGAEKTREAGIPIAGGHTVQDDEPKYGLVVVGAIHPDRLTRKGGARPGDQLLLSKPLGVGVVTTAMMRDTATSAEADAAIKSMLQLNRQAAELAHAYEATAVTDITGFGLLGHAYEMTDKGGVGFEIRYAHLPWLPGAERLGVEWVYPGGAHDNRKYFGEHISFDGSLAEWQQVLCFSPETSGGLLIAMPPDRVNQVLEEAISLDLPLWRVGQVTDGGGIHVL